MLTFLKIQDLILVEKAEIELGDGLNIFTGETGAGKSAILTAIRLLAGGRADSEWIRSGATFAAVEAKLSSFPIDKLEEIDPPPPGEPLRVRREIHKSGKTRCFIEDQLVSVSHLRELMRPMIEMVDQSSSTAFSAPEEQRNILDAFAGLENEAASLSKTHNEMSESKRELEEALAAGLRRARDLEWAESSLKEIEDANWKKEEEERLGQSHLLLTHAQEIAEKIEAAIEGLASLSPHLRRIAYLLEGAAALDARIRPTGESVKTASLEIDEAERFLRSYADRLDADPARLSSIENRIGAIETLKRKFGPTWEEVEKKKIELSLEIKRMAFLEDAQASLEAKVKALEEKTAAAAEQLSDRRQKASVQFSKTVLQELHTLNLPHARFEVRIAKKPLSATGADEIQFLFSANPGAPLLPLNQCASGGELSRVLFAAKIALAEKDKVRCIVFDEIDSNVGGQTAAVLGEKLKRLSQNRQAICVTHFVQVARCALHHFGVSKQESNGKAQTFVQRLANDAREREFARMIGTHAS